MDVQILLDGMLVGLAVAAPVGPVGVLCIQLSATRGKRHGFVAGMGAATADAMYAAVAAFGLTVISDFIEAHLVPLRFIGAFLLCYLGVRLFLARPRPAGAAAEDTNHVLNYGSTLILTLTNPITFVAFAALFAGFGLVDAESEFSSALSLVVGVFLGSTAWWLALSLIGGAFRERLTHLKMRLINRIAGVAVAGFGLVVFISLLVK